jgi:hypothetical protein
VGGVLIEGEAQVPAEILEGLAGAAVSIVWVGFAGYFNFGAGLVALSCFCDG